MYGPQRLLSIPQGKARLQLHIPGQNTHFTQPENSARLRIRPRPLLGCKGISVNLFGTTGRINTKRKVLQAGRCGVQRFIQAKKAMRTTSGTVAHVRVLFCIVLIWTFGGRVEAQPPAPFPPASVSAPAGPSARAGTVAGLRTLEDAWRIALDTNHLLEASQWNASASAGSLSAARAERLPSLTLGADYIALSQGLGIKLPASPILPSQVPFVGQDTGGTCTPWCGNRFIRRAGLRAGFVRQRPARPPVKQISGVPGWT